MKEVEVKAWIRKEQKSSVEKYLRDNADFIGEKSKNDVMYCKKLEENMSKNTSENIPEKKQIEFRLREEISIADDGIEKTTFWVTRKSREYGENGEEINEELEFEIGNKNDFHTFSLQLGYEVMYEKQKKVQQFTLKNSDTNVLIEQVEMNGLGEFLEVEKVCEATEVSLALEEVMAVIIDAGLENEIEKKPYGMLLGEF